MEWKKDRERERILECISSVVRIADEMGVDDEVKRRVYEEALKWYPELVRHEGEGEEESEEEDSECKSTSGS